MSSLAFRSSNGTKSGRLRPSNLKSEPSPETKGYSATKTTNGTSLKSRVAPDHDALLQLLKTTSDHGQTDVKDLVQTLLHLQAHNEATEPDNTLQRLLLDMLHIISAKGAVPPQTLPQHEDPIPPAAPKTDSPPAQPLLLTSLGHTIVASSDEPIAAANESPTLPRAGSLLTAQSPTSVTSVNSTPPQRQPHAATWQDVIASGRSGDPLSIDGQVLRNPSIVTVDTHGSAINVPLALAVDASSHAIGMTPEIRPVARPVRNLFSLASAGSSIATANTTVRAVIPHVLVASNLSGNETTTVPPGFVIAGDIKLFGGLDAERYSYRNGDDKSEMVVIKKSPVSMDELLPNQGFSFGSIMLTNPTITLLSKTSSTGRDIGLWLDAEVALTGTFAEAGSILGDIFANHIPSVQISVHLGGYQGLGDVYKAPADLLVKASLAGIDTKIGKYLELTSAEVDVHGVRSATGYAWTVSVSGSALLTVPGSVAPISTTYTVSKTQSTYKLDLKLNNDLWENAMGVPGFHLQTVSIDSSFTSGTKDSPFVFNINASLALDATVISVKGSYSGDQWAFDASVGDFTLQQLEAAFSKLFKANLTPLGHSVVFTGLSLNVNSTDKRLELKGGVKVDDYTSSSATLDIGTTGVHLVGDMNDVVFDKVTLSKAHMDLIIVKSGLVDPSPKTPGTSAAFTILGTVKVNSEVSIDAEVSFVKAAGSALVWVVYAKATLGFTLSKFVPKLPADLDFKLDNVVVMASNSDDASVFPAHAFDYQVKKGFHLYAKIGCPPALASTLHTNPSALTLELDLGSAQQEIEFIFGADQQLALKPGMVAPNIKAGIQLTDVPQLFVEGDISVQLKGQPGPLVFALRMQVGITEAQASAALMTDWINPFGISPQVKVLAPVTLGVIIDYAAVTYPSGVSFQGGLQVGETLLHAAFEVGENPQDGVLLVHAENLGIKDIISFASLVIEKQLPAPQTDIIYFKDLYLGVSSGGTIGSVFYPPGVTFNADMLIFGKEIKIHCAVDKQLPGFALQAEIDAFELGPLIVSGDLNKNPTLDLQVGTKLQHLTLDGKISLFDSDIAINLVVDLVSSLLSFDAELKFTDLLLFKLQAKTVGKIDSIKDAVKAEISLFADFEQTLLDHIMALANTYIATAKKASDEGIDSAKAKLTQTQKTYDDHLAQCQRDLNDAQAKFDKRKADVTAAVDARKKAITDEGVARQAAVDQAQKGFDAKIASLVASLQQTKNDAAAKIKSAQDAVTQAQQNGTKSINDARNVLTAKTNDMSNRFGSADQAIRDKENDVKSAQNKIAGIQSEINGTSNPFKKAGYEIEMKSAQAGLLVAQGALSAARAVLTSGAYTLAKAAMAAAQTSLDAAIAAAKVGTDAANATLVAATGSANLSISAAQQSLNTAKTASNELHVLQAAQDALTKFQQGEKALLDAADSLTQALASSVEKVAFDAASNALKIAQGATKELDAAKSVLDEVEKAADEFANFGQWVIKRGGNIFNVKSLQLSGTLNDASNKKPFTAHIQGTFADADVNVSVEFSPGSGEDFVKKLVLGFVDDAKSNLKKYIKF